MNPFLIYWLLTRDRRDDVELDPKFLCIILAIVAVLSIALDIKMLWR
ncbi:MULTISPECIES: hypothetical protein [unclassified Bradyrhizobium]|nr:MULTISPECIES: hypothetical protein [unclassified Bradyrhizobium]